MRFRFLGLLAVVVIISIAGSLPKVALSGEVDGKANSSGERPLRLKKVSEGFIYEEAPFPSCHASTLEQTTDGTLVAAWFGGQHEKADDVGIWVSRLIEGRWSPPVEVANGVQFQWATPQPVAKSDSTKDGSKLDGTMTNVMRYPTWNPVLFQVDGGPLLLFYKAGPNPDRWWGMVCESIDQGKTWSAGQRLPEGILGPIKNKPVQLADGTILCPSSNETPDELDLWTVHFERYNPKDKSWTKTAPLNDGKQIGAIQPSILKLGGDKLLAIGRSRQGKVFQIASSDNGVTWGEMGLIELPNPNSGTDAVTLHSGEHVLIYNHVTKKSEEWGGRRSPLNLAISSDGYHWVSDLELENEPKKEFSYPAIIQTHDGKIHVTYTWYRERIKHVVLELLPE